MIIYEGPGDILASTRQTLVCTTNVVGAMGKGLALAFAQRYPDLLAFYQAKFPRHDGRKLNPLFGRQLHVFPINDTQQCLLFPTKMHWRNPSPWALIADNLQLLQRQYRTLNIQSMAIPPLGCSNGGLNYHRDIRPLMMCMLRDAPFDVDILTGVDNPPP